MPEGGDGRSDIGQLIDRIRLAARVAGVKPETVCYNLFRDRDVLASLERVRDRLERRRIAVEDYILRHGGGDG